MRAPTAAPPPNRLLVLALLALLALLAAGTPALAQQRANGRILGVFNELTFEPLAGAEVIDLATGLKAVTTETGTISLAYLLAGTSVLQIRKMGYGARTVSVAVSTTDTGSVTVVLTPLSTTLPAVLTEERPSPADPRWKLGVVGFLSRQHTLSAPASAYVTAEQIARWKLTQLSDLKTRNGRGVCGDVYIDGAHQDMGPLAQGSYNYRKAIDEWLRPESVAGIEIYTEAEAPYPYFQPQAPLTITRVNGKLVPTSNGTAIRKAAGSARCAVTLIWTK